MKEALALIVAVFATAVFVGFSAYFIGYCFSLGFHQAM
jgi:hypothetical protein